MIQIKIIKQKSKQNSNGVWLLIVTKILKCGRGCSHVAFSIIADDYGKMWSMLS